MLINFDLESGSFPVQSTFKGGRWKDRLTAKKAQQHHFQKTAKLAGAVEVSQPANGQDPEASDPSERPYKKARIDESANHTPWLPSAAAHSRPTSKNSAANGKPRQIVSSLFSFNPESKTRADKPAEETQDVDPSNAPLTSELETFTSLGLSPLLAEHLLRKLNIKAPTAIQKATISQLMQEDADAFVQAETGSGKTLAYLLPILQKIMALTSLNERAHRTSGLFAIILAPTRELSKQISVVLEGLLRCAYWIVSGTVIGGEKKKSEKARLRKGLNILIATPGRLADHLDHTEVLDVSRVRWVVLDEGDRLMELGFEQDLERILSKLNARVSATSGIAGLPARRTTVLCSATMKMSVQKLGEMTLKDAIHIQGADSAATQLSNEDGQDSAFAAPAQLKQSYAVVPAKLRLVSLVALLKRSFARRGPVMKVIVFISCADSVDFHFEVLSRDPASGRNIEAQPPLKKDVKKSTKHDTTLSVNEKPVNTSEITDPTTGSEESITATTTPSPLSTQSAGLTFTTPNNPIHLFRLHGSLPQSLRTATLAAFRTSALPSVLLCTDVASRGLDLPHVDLVVEYDPPFTRDEHLHRIGRTARAGADGRALIFLQPGAEEGYVDILRQSRREGHKGLSRTDAAELLRKGFAAPTGLVGGGGGGGSGGADWEQRATDWQLDAERWALEDTRALEMARRAFQSSVRAYATHAASERHVFDMGALHLGHVAKAFALRDKPGSIRVPGLRPGKGSVGANKAERRANALAGNAGARADGEAVQTTAGESHAIRDAAARKMRQMARKAASGASEFNIG